LKQFIREDLAKEIEETLHFFEEQEEKLLKSTNKQHQARKFSGLPRNRLSIEEEKSKELPPPSKKDLDDFAEFFSQGCCLKLNCTKRIDFSKALDCFKNFITLSPAEQDFFVYGQLQSFSRLAKSRKNPKGIVFDYHVSGEECCRKMFQLVHGNFSDKWLDSRLTHFKQKDFIVIDQRGGCRNALPLEERLDIHNFLSNYLQNVILESPRNGLNLLPTSFTFQEVYQEYQAAGGTRSLSTLHSHFKSFWPDVRKIRSYSDYCSTCFVKRRLIDSATTEEEKIEYQESLEAHKEHARSAREYYKVVNIGRALLHEENEFLCLSFDWGQNWDIP